MAYITHPNTKTPRSNWAVIAVPCGSYVGLVSEATIIPYCWCRHSRMKETDSLRVFCCCHCCFVCFYRASFAWRGNDYWEIEVIFGRNCGKRYEILEASCPVWCWPCDILMKPFLVWQNFFHITISHGPSCRLAFWRIELTLCRSMHDVFLVAISTPRPSSPIPLLLSLCF